MQRPLFLFFISFIFLIGRLNSTYLKAQNNSNEIKETNQNLTQIDDSFQSKGFFIEMQKQFITIHTIYHDYVDGLSSHLSSKNDVKNLTILLLTLFGVLGLLLLRKKLFSETEFGKKTKIPSKGKWLTKSNILTEEESSLKSPSKNEWINDSLDSLRILLKDQTEEDTGNLDIEKFLLELDEETRNSDLDHLGEEIIKSN